MRSSHSLLLSLVHCAVAHLSLDNLAKHPGVATLTNSFNPVQEAYWTGYPHHRRTPFAVSPDGTKSFVAYLDSSGTDVHVQPIDPETFKATGTAVTVTGGKEAGGLVAHDDGFALLTNEVLPSGTADAPAGETPVAVLYRYTDGEQSWKTFLGGPRVEADFGLMASPDLTGDLVYSADANYYAAYFVVTAYTGDAAGHFGDAIRYVTPDGKLETIAGASSSWGCSHNTGIAIEAASEPPFASLCAEDQGAIWLNTKTQGMSNDGVKVSNEMTINGGSNEPMGGIGGSYSSLARLIGQSSYIFAWVSRGAIDLTLNDWMGEGYTKAQNRTNNRNVAIALFSDKQTIVGEQATSEVGAEDGDSQINWVTEGSADCSNAHVAALDGSQALVTWEEISSPICDFEAMGCRGEFSGTMFQLVDSKGAKVGEAIKATDTYIAGDMVTMGDGRVCWPYIDMSWKLDGPAASLPDATTKELSFACVNVGSGSADEGSQQSSSTASSTTAQTASTSQRVTASSSTTKASASSAASESASNTTQDVAEPSTTSKATTSTKAAEETSVTESVEAPSSTTLSSTGTKGCTGRVRTVFETVTVTGGRVRPSQV